MGGCLSTIGPASAAPTGPLPGNVSRETSPPASDPTQLRLDRLEVDLARAQKHNRRLRGHAQKLAGLGPPDGTGGGGQDPGR